MKRCRRDNIKIQVKYLSPDLQKLVGKKEEVILMPSGSRSGDFIDRLGELYPELLEKYGPGYLGFELNKKKPHVLTPLKDGDRYEFTIWTKEEIVQDEIMKKLKGSRALIELPRGEFKMPKWMECTWQRVPCGRDDCPICGRIKRDRQRHIKKGEDPDDIKCALEDMGRNFKEVMEMIKKDAERMGIDITNIEDIQEPPQPEEFPLYKRAMEWQNLVFEILESATQLGEFWVYTETFQNLSWYSNLLPAKVYRQLCNRWHIKERDDYGEFDYKYTKYVISECLKILKKSLKELGSFNSGQRDNLTLISNQLSNLEKEILEI